MPLADQARRSRERAHARRGKQALKSLTRLFESGRGWTQWWARDGASFVFAAGRGGEASPGDQAAAPRVMATWLHGIPVESRRVAFCLDVSPGRVDGGISTLDGGARCCGRSSVSRARVHVIFFDAEIHRFSKRMTFDRRRWSSRDLHRCAEAARRDETGRAGCGAGQERRRLRSERRRTERWRSRRHPRVRRRVSSSHSSPPRALPHDRDRCGESLARAIGEGERWALRDSEVGSASLRYLSFFAGESGVFG